ncbi:MAG: sensor domain-containing diguanylate cyclase [Pseudomonadota bacterium]
MFEQSKIPRPPDEQQRLAALHRYGLLDTPADSNFDFLADMAAALCATQYAYVSLVDAERVWYKASHGKLATENPRDGDYCSWTILEPEGLHIPDLSADPRTAHMALTLSNQYRMYYGANLISSDGFRIGTLCVLDATPRQLAPDTMALLVRLARQVMSLIELRASSRALEAAYATMEKLATFDELTGLLNRRALLTRLREEIDRSSRFGSPLSLALIDLDHFKQVNDHHGHLAGDAVLRGVGQLLRERTRSTDAAGRYGGEEFCVILPGADTAAAAILGEKLRAAIEETPFHADASATLQATASIGIATYEPLRGANAERLIAAADQAMYRAKQGGRNRIIVEERWS